MKKTFFALSMLLITAGGMLFSAQQEAHPMKIAIVNFKVCVEKSKLGKREQAHFDQMRKNLEETLEKKEKELNDLAPKFSDEYVDTLTPEAEKDLKEKFKTMSQELTQQQNQYYQLLNQTNFQMIQKMVEAIQDAAKKVAKDKGYDLVLNEEACFYKGEALDASSDIIAKLDEAFEAEMKEKK